MKGKDANPAIKYDIALVFNEKNMLEQYLAVSQYINWDNREVKSLAGMLANGIKNDMDIAGRCFEWVRDNIKHSLDYKLNPVTVKASDVLKYGTGFCFSKSHLLAALLRCNGIPAGLCYQRLVISEEDDIYCLHGLNAVYLKSFGWYRIDARGNKEGVDARFIPPVEKLAFSVKGKKEADFREIWSEPLPIVTKALNLHKDYISLSKNLPDTEVVYF